jgi:hypothetical protein
VNRNPDVDAWFDAKQHPLEDAMQAVRLIILSDERVEESIKWQTPTFAYKGNIVSFNPAKKLVSLLFHRGAEIPGDHPRLEGDGKLARTMRFADLADVAAHGGELADAIAAWCEWRDAG